MPNELGFEIEITRDQINTILSHSEVTYIVLSGNYTYLGEGAWGMSATAEGYNSDHINVSHPPVNPCPKPCP